MWKLTVKYNDGSQGTIEGKQKAITPVLLGKYLGVYATAKEAIYQQYPKKDHEAIVLKSDGRIHDDAVKKLIEGLN